MRLYVETSAAAKLLIEEPESEPLARFLEAAVERDTALVSSLVLETELRRLAVRWSLPQGAVSDVLRRFDLLLPDRAVYRDAGLLAGAHLRSLDALHVAAALRLNAAAMLSYDARQGDAARSVGLEVIAPG